MSRIANKFAELRKKRKSALITYTVTCDPDQATAQAIMDILPSAGADIIELGMAFSDPTADGPTIQEAAQRGLLGGASLVKTLEMVYNFRQKNNETPIILMGYYNPILRYGVENFCKDAAASGADGMIIVDLPPEEEGEFVPTAEKYKLSLIKLIAPTTDDARLPLVLKNASGFVYYISMAGVSGTKSVNPGTVVPFVTNIKKHTDLPVAVGFGIKTPAHAKEIAKYSDAVVVGSAIVERIGKASKRTAAQDVFDFVSSIAKVL